MMINPYLKNPETRKPTYQKMFGLDFQGFCVIFYWLVLNPQPIAHLLVI